MGAVGGRSVIQVPNRLDQQMRAAARIERLASYWAKRGDLPRAALARRTARLQLQTVQLEQDRGGVELRLHEVRDASELEHHSGIDVRIGSDSLG